MKKKLTNKQKMFCKEYLIDLNATNASRRAGYSKKTANRIGSENLSKPLIQEYIQKNMNKRAEKIEITADRVLQEIAKMAYCNMEDYLTFNDDGTAFVDFSAMNRDKAAAIQEVTIDTYFDTSLADKENKKGRTVKKIKFKLADKKGSLDLLGRHLKLFGDQEKGDSGNTYITNIIQSFSKGKRELSESERGRISESIRILGQNINAR